MKIIVIGSGLLGISTAYFLSLHDHDITVIDRRQGPGLETSFANLGMLTPSHAAPWNSPGILEKILYWFGKEDSPFLLRPRAVLSLMGWGIGFIRNSNMDRYLINLHKNARLAYYSLAVLKDLRQQIKLHYDESTKGTLKIYRDENALDNSAEFSKLLRELEIRYKVLGSNEVPDVEPALSSIGSNIAGGIFYQDDESGDAFK